MDQISWHSLAVGDILGKLSTKKEGLSEREAERRLKAVGPNKIKLERKEKAWAMLLRQIKSPLILILIFAGIITIFLGSHLDTIVIFAVVFLNGAIGFFQEKRALKTLHSLQEKQEFFTWVRRDGAWKEKLIEYLVPGDIIRLKPGDTVPADARLIASTGLSVNEAVLTGEFLSVNKKAGTVKEDTPLAERKNMVFRGTTVSDGKAESVIVRTGKRTEFGQIGRFLEDIEETRTPFEEKVQKLGRFLTVSIVFLSILLMVVGILSGQNIEEMFLITVAVVVSAIPEGLPIAVTVILAIGMTRILSKKGLVKKLSATEALGSTSVILTDKTGTLTTGEMAVDNIFTATRKRGLFDISPSKDEKDIRTIFETAVLTTESIIENPEDKKEDWKIHGRPTDKAMFKAALEAGVSSEKLETKYETIKNIPFNSDRKFSASITKNKANEIIVFYIGAPEVLLQNSREVKLEDRTYVMRPDEKIDAKNMVSQLAAEGLRVIAVGYRKLSQKEDLESLQEHNVMNEGTFFGFITLKDPVREDVADTIEKTKQANIKTVIVTGDHALTAKAVAKEIGLGRGGEYAFRIMEGKEVEALDDEELAHQVRSIDIFARVTPKNKLKIVQAWQSHDEIVAVSGDGVNDAPAIKMADVGIAVGSGTDLSKETSDIILLNNSFSTIVAAVREGRVILDNLKKVVAYLLSDSLTEIAVITISLLVGLPVPVLPAQILWINLIEGSFPSIALAFDPAEKDILKFSPPRRKSPLIDRKIKTLIGVVGGASVIFTFAIFLFFLSGSSSIEHVRTMVFAALATNSLFYAFSMRSLRRPIWQTDFLGNKHLIGALAIAFVLLVAAIYLPPLQTLLRTEPLSGLEWIILTGFGILNVVTIEIAKWFLIKKRKEK